MKFMGQFGETERYLLIEWKLLFISLFSFALLFPLPWLIRQMLFTMPHFNFYLWFSVMQGHKPLLCKTLDVVEGSQMCQKL